MENITPNNQAAQLSATEAEQLARIMQAIKDKKPATEAFVIKPPVVNPAPAAVSENKIETPPVQPPVQVKLLTKEEYGRIKNQAPIPIPKELQAKLQAVSLSNVANERASREPFPDNTAEAFDPITPEVEVTNLDLVGKKDKAGNPINPIEKIIVRPIVPADLRTFKLTNSPLYQLLVGDIQKEEDAITKFSIEENSLYDLVWQFTHTSREASALAKQGPEAFHDMSFDLAHKYSADDLLKITQVVIGYIGKANGAKTQFSTPQTQEEIDAGDKKKQSLTSPKDTV